MSNSGEGTPAGGTTILCLSFNQDASCLALGTRSGYRIIQCSPFSTAFSSESGGVGCCEMLHCTSLLALVGGGDRPAFSPRQLRLVNTKTAKVMLEANFVTAVLAVRMSRKRVVVCLATAIHIFDLETRICLQMLETSPNAEGVIAMSDSDPGSSRGACTIAFPGGLGEVILLDGDTLKVLNKVRSAFDAV
jgi:autophagy-related protein 18